MIKLKSDAEIDAMRAAGALAAQTLLMIEEYIRPGITTLELNDICHEFTIKNNAIPAPLNYHGFPKSICTSVNHVVCHGIPNKKQVLKIGDIINIDVTPIVDGFHGDTSKTYVVGEASDIALKLIKVAEECLNLGISVVRPGVRVGDIGAVIQAHAESHEFSIVQDFVGHGIGRKFHEDPQIPHYGVKGRGVRLEKGMVFTIEPMINVGEYHVKILDDKWTVETVDKSLSAQFEHTIAIRGNGEVEILTRL